MSLFQEEKQITQIICRYMFIYFRTILCERKMPSPPPRPFRLWCAGEQTLPLPAAALGKMAPAPSGVAE